MPKPRSAPARCSERELQTTLDSALPADRLLQGWAGRRSPQSCGVSDRTGGAHSPPSGTCSRAGYLSGDTSSILPNSQMLGVCHLWICPPQ